MNPLILYPAILLYLTFGAAYINYVVRRDGSHMPLIAKLFLLVVLPLFIIGDIWVEFIQRH